MKGIFFLISFVDASDVIPADMHFDTWECSRDAWPGVWAAGAANRDRVSLMPASRGRHETQELWN